MHVKQIQEQGYTVIKGGNPGFASQLDIVKNLYETTPRPEGKVPYLNQGHSVIYSLQDKDPIFILSLLRNPVVMEVLTHFLNDEWYRNVNPNFILRSMIARSGGSEALPLHIDSFIPSSGKYCWSLQISMILENQTEENGCFRCVPGSHLYDWYANQADTSVPIESEAGDILVWDSRLHHGTTANKTGKTRWAWITTVTRWWIKQAFQIPKTFPFKDYLTKEEQAVIGYLCESPLDEYERQDIKRGYQE